MSVDQKYYFPTGGLPSQKDMMTQRAVFTAAYAVIANQGVEAWPYVIVEIRTRAGEVLYRREMPPIRRLVEPAVQADLSGMLEGTIEDGTGRAAMIAWPAAGKTGTSQDYRDAWFVGFTRQIVTGVWIGNDNGAAMNRVTGGGLSARIWADYMATAQQRLPQLTLVDTTVPRRHLRQRRHR